MLSQFLLLLLHHHHHHHHLFTLLLFLFFLHPAADADSASDKAALLRFSSAVGGRTSSWNRSNSTPCFWKGVGCDNATRVVELRLPGHGLSGQIPLNSIGSLTHLRNVSLQRNSLSGSLPLDLSSCTELERLILQGNQFSGEIPTTLFALNNLTRLSLARNKFSGDISPDFNNLTNLRALYLENNHLTGSIPELNNLTLLREFNVSYNNLSGLIPSSLNKFSSNSFLSNFLCGSPLDACPSGTNDGNKLSAGAIAGIVIGSVTGLILIIVALFIARRIYGSKITPRQVEMSPSPAPLPPPDIEFGSPKPLFIGENSGLGNEDSGPATARTGDVGVVVQSVGDDGLVFFGNGVLDFGMEELLRASAEVLGKGTFGSTYKAYMERNIEVVVKRLKNVCVNEREFREKVVGLGMLVHENLMPLKGYFYGREEKLLVYDCMPMGSLSTLLHGNRGTDRAALTWEIRSKIALGAARGIDYLHSLGISHGNVRSSNVLLTDSYAACVSEFGISQLVSTTSTLNLNGYCAPEVTDTRKISRKADVYSFGVLLLELLTGKVPTHALHDEEGVDLPRWVQAAVQENRTIDVLDPELLRFQNQNQNQNRDEQMVQLLHVGISCTSQHADTRPSMAEVTQRLEEICGSRS